MILRNIYKTFPVACLLSLAGCASEEIIPDFASAVDENVIRIASGVSGPASRAIDTEPTYAGQCDADRLSVFKYRGTHTASSVVVNDMKFVERIDTIIDHFSDPTSINEDGSGSYSQSDKWVRKYVTLNFDGLKRTGFAFPALAYSFSGQDLFSVNPQSGEAYSSLELSLTGTSTPELFFGRVMPDVDRLKIDKPNFNTNGIVEKYNTSSNNSGSQLKGTLYRIVSQININITDVDTDLVERMTMEVSNLPIETGLFAEHRTALNQKGVDHGYHYPIVAASSDSQHLNRTVVVAETDNFHNGVAKMSTFLLPSDKGRSLSVHIYFTDGTDKTYEVRPPNSYYIPEDMSEVYFSSTPLCVYNMSDNLFYSYSNVRVNINGVFENFFADWVNVDMDIEICPRYDNEHTYDNIDYN